MDKNNLMNNENISDINNNPFITENKINYNPLLNTNNDYCRIINININLLKEIFENNFINSIDESIKNKIFLIFDQISLNLNFMFKEKENIFSIYESILRKNEEKIRKLYSDIFNLKIKDNYSEILIENLLQKEKEFNLIKEKTGISVENGNVIYNDRKENEIFILRKENSNLKIAVNKNEIELTRFKKKYEKDKFDFQEKINKLNYKITILKNQLEKNDSTKKMKSTSNINKKLTSLKKESLNNKNIFLNYVASSGILDFKNKIVNKLNEFDKENKSKMPFLNLKNINDSDIYNRKILYLTPRNQINDIKITNCQIFHNNTGTKKKAKNKIIYNTNNNKSNKNSKNKIIKKYRIILQKRKKSIKQQLNSTTNISFNDPLIPSSPVKINKIYVINHKVKKIEKDNNFSYKMSKIANLKGKRNKSNIIANKSYDILNNLNNLTSTNKKIFSKSPINNYKNTFIISKKSK